MIFQREEILIGKDNLNKLKNSHVLIFGCGGVGGFAIEALVRGGVGTLTVVDFDTIDITNTNRQIIANKNTIGKDKVLAIKERAEAINPNIKINAIKKNYNSETRDFFFKFKTYDYIIDAIDSVSSKLDLIETSIQKNIPIISSMGTGNKINPTMLEISDIYKTSVCPLAKIIRKELKNRKIKKLKVLYSKELPIKPSNALGNNKKIIGSISFVPAVAGLIIGGEVIKDICNLKNLGGN